MSRNDIRDELSEVHPLVWLFLVALVAGGLGTMWQSTLGPILRNTIDAVKNGNWTQTVGELPQIGEITAVTVVGVVVAAFVALFFIGRGIRALVSARKKPRSRRRDDEREE
jgi:hypothetical protein